MTHNVLIIEDNPDIARLVQSHLHDIDCESSIVANGVQGVQAFTHGAFDLVVLDLMLPGLDGLAVCQRLRAMPAYVPILMLTAKTSELDRVLGLEMGADDYLCKPFSIPEFLARVKALFQRVDALTGPNVVPATETLRSAGLVVDVRRREVTVDDEAVSLTAREFDLLVHFAQHPGRVHNRAQLLDAVWGYGHEGYEHTVNSHINRLRAKIEPDPAKPRYVLTVWGVGYKFAEPGGAEH